MLQRLARALYRRPGERSPGAWGLVILLAVAVGFIGTLLAREARRWERAAPSFRIETADWRALPGAEAGACADGIGPAAPPCPAHPATPALWESSRGRTPGRGAGLDGDFWIGARVPAERVAKAAAASAHYLVLGWIKGEYEIWAAGERYLRGSRDDQEPVILALPPSVLARNQPLPVAIRIRAEPGAAVPDVLAHPLSEGLATREEASAFRSLVGFWKKSRPFALFLVNLVFAAFFFLTWLAERQKREYYFIAVYAAVCALFQARMMDMFLGLFTPTVNYSIDIMLRSSEGAFGMFLGLAFARVPRPVFSWGVPLAVALPLAFAVALPDGASKYALNTVIDQWIVPALYLTGALACAVQAVYLASSGRLADGALRSRTVRLALFACGLAGITALYVVQAHGLVAFAWKALVSRFAHFGLVLFLGATALLEYKRRLRLLEDSPTSHYHRRPRLPEKLSGAVLVVDIRNSEALFRASGELGDSGRLVGTCISHLWAAATAGGGTVLGTEGDLLRAFFDRDACPNPVAAALAVTDDMARSLAAASEQFAAQGLVPPWPSGAGTIAFRGGIACGDIRPVWQGAGGERYASWVEAGDSHPFVESARMTELERGIGAGGNDSGESLVLLSERAAAELETAGGARPAGSWLFRNQAFIGKHGQTHVAAGYVPASGNREGKPWVKAS